MLYAEQPGVHDVMARKSVHDVVALIIYSLVSQYIPKTLCIRSC